MTLSFLLTCFYTLRSLLRLIQGTVCISQTLLRISNVSLPVTLALATLPASALPVDTRMAQDLELLFHHTRDQFFGRVWDFVAEDDDMQAVKEVRGDKGMLTVVLSFFADKFMVLQSTAIMSAHVPPSYTATFRFARIVRLLRGDLFRWPGHWRLNVRLP